MGWSIAVLLGQQIVQISKYPRIFVFENFLNDRECQFLIDLAYGRLEPSSVHVNNNATIDASSSMRQSHSFTIPTTQIYKYDILDRIQLKLRASFTQLRATSEPLQVQLYQENQAYGLHYDTNPSVQREMTVVIYLNTVVLGGETIFPQQSFSNVLLNTDLGVTRRVCRDHVSPSTLKIRPKRGRAVIFYPSDPRTLHGSCPVVFGYKYVAQQWFMPHRRM